MLLQVKSSYTLSNNPDMLPRRRKLTHGIN